MELPRHPGANWHMPSRYKVVELIGSGSYGSVCQATDSGKPGEEELVAIKRCKKLFQDVIDCKRILREINILADLNHPNVVRVKDVFIDKWDINNFDELYIVMEICDADLKKLCKQDVNLTALHIKMLLYNLLVGLKYVHSAGIYHRDLKPANCFVNQDCTVKIGDFGLSRAIGGEHNHLSHLPHTPRGEDDNSPPQPAPAVPPTARLRKNLTGHVVTRWYRAPELILLQEDYTEAIDVWSVGCIFAELLGMLEGMHYLDRGPLFPGSSCFPLSPDHKHKSDYKYHTQGKQDMLNKIFNTLGTPSKEDKATITRDDAKRYLEQFADRKGAGLQNHLAEVGCRPDDDSLDVMAKMLHFNYLKRITVAEALDHPLFSEIRTAEKETTSPSVINLPFEKEADLDEPLLRKYYWQEVGKYHPDKTK